MALNIIDAYCTAFKRYGEKRKYTLDSIEVHSIGVAQSNAEVIRNNMNVYNPSGIVHAVIDCETEGKVLLLLPEDNVAWADGGYGNNHSYTIEMCESKYMRYTGGANYTITQQSNFVAQIKRGYNTYVEFVAMLCKKFGFIPTDKLPNGLHRVYSHDEGRQAGVSSAHVDVSHLWPKIGKDMDDFRADVMKAMGETPVEQNWYRVRKTWTDRDSQLGAYSNLENAKAACVRGYAVYDYNGNEVYRNELDINTMTCADLEGMSEAEKIAAVAPIYQDCQSRTGMLASVGLAQFALESGYGTTDLARFAQNFHGMKCSLSGNTWSGSAWDGVSKYTKKTAEQDKAGNVYYVTADFRKYPCIMDSVNDRAAYFIGANNGAALRYPGIANITSAEEQVKAIKKGGYATDVSYVSKLMSIINRFNLTQYDLAKQPQNDSKTKATTTIYRIQIGAYKVKSSATKLVNKAKANGFAAFVEQEGGMYHVYAGSFEGKENAVARVAALKNAGMTAIIKTVEV